MATTLYTPAIRVLACPQCGAPVTASRAGGLVPCPYCKAQSEIAPRNDARDLTRARQAAPQSDAARFAQLRQQALVDQTLPSPLRKFLGADVLVSQRVDEGFERWRAAIKQLRQKDVSGFRGADIASNEQVFHWSLLLADALVGDGGGAVKARSILETACDHLVDASHRQVLYGALSTVAAREGDVPSAREWLQRCAANGTDLRADTAYRYAFAYVATLEGDHQTVLRVLGAAKGDLPFAARYRLRVTVLRANALLNLGRDGTTELERAVSSSPLGKYHLQTMIDQEVCLKLHRSLANAATAEDVPPPPGASVLGVSLLAMVLVAYVVIDEPQLRSIWTTGIAVGIATFIVAATYLLIRKQIRARAIIRRGRYALARVDKFTKLATLSHRLTVYPPSGNTYQATVNQEQYVVGPFNALATASPLHNEQAGALIMVKYDVRDDVRILV